jgi:predicted small secreted protein
MPFHLLAILPSLIAVLLSLGNPYNILLHGGRITVSKLSMKITLLITATAAALLLSSCNTMIGLGRDMRMGGESLENSASKVHGGGEAADTSGAPVY